jgi:hypothetical protein
MKKMMCAILVTVLTRITKNEVFQDIQTINSHRLEHIR